MNEELLIRTEMSLTPATMPFIQSWREQLTVRQVDERLIVPSWLKVCRRARRRRRLKMPPMMQLCVL